MRKECEEELVKELGEAMTKLNNAKSDLERAQIKRSIRGIQDSLKKLYDDDDMPTPGLRLGRKKGDSVLDIPDSYVVIDLETTGFSPMFDEIIELGAIRYENRVQTGSFSSLIRPTCSIPDVVVAKTGITDNMTANAPVIEDVLPRFLAFIGDAVLVGHNVGFDINFLYDNAVRLGLDPVCNDHVNTLRLANRLLPGMRRRRLENLAEELGIPVTVSHRALDDCQTTADCLEMLRDIADKCGGVPDSPSPGVRAEKADARNVTPETTAFNPDGPIYGRTFVFTGELHSYTRQQAMQEVVNAGGFVGNGVTRATNYLVVGDTEYVASVRGGKTGKMKKAENLALNGQDISIISEDAFLEFLAESSEAPSSHDESPNDMPEDTENQVVISSFEQERPSERDSIREMWPELTEAVRRCGGDESMLSVASAKPGKASGGYVSLKLGSMVVFRLGLRGKSKYLSFPDMFADMAPEAKVEKGQKYVRLPVDSSHPLEGYADLIMRLIAATVDRYPAEWSCCSRYMECSNARACVNPDKRIALACSYRKALNSGRVFFGENRNI